MQMTPNCTRQSCQMTPRSWFESRHGWRNCTLYVWWPAIPPWLCCISRICCIFTVWHCHPMHTRQTQSRLFSFAVPRWWNELSNVIRAEASLSSWDQSVLRAPTLLTTQTPLDALPALTVHFWYTYLPDLLQFVLLNRLVLTEVLTYNSSSVWWLWSLSCTALCQSVCQISTWRC